MIYFSEAFRNYEEFKELFGTVKHGNGKESRRNGILLSMFKSRELLHAHASRKETYYKINKRWECVKPQILGSDSWYTIRTMSVLQAYADNAVMDESRNRYGVNVTLRNRCYGSKDFRTDDFNGLCEDKDTSSIRYVNMEKQRVYKKRAGRFYRDIVEGCPTFCRLLPYAVRNWLCEVLAEEWKAYAASEMNDRYTLHVNKNFSDIYDSYYCLGYDDDDDSFGSCMVNDGFFSFYDNAVKAHAAYLTDEDDMIVARCIIYDEVHVYGSDKVLRLAERQYAASCDESLKRQLVIALINGGYIDGYKKIGAGCSDSHDFLDCKGNPMDSTDFWIQCNLEDGDTLSYQDSFKYFDYSMQRAYNGSNHDFDDELTETNGVYECSENYVYCEDSEDRRRRDDCYYCEGRNEYFAYYESVCSPVNRDGYEHLDDCVCVGGDYYYAGRDAERPYDYGLCLCANCDEYFREDESYYSELTEEDYCCERCRDEAEQEYKERNWHYSEYDDEYYEDEDDVVTAFQWDGECYGQITISVSSFRDLVRDGEAAQFDGAYFIDDLNDEGDPVHYDMILVAA